MKKDEQKVNQIQIVPGIGMMVGDVKLSNCAPRIVGVYATDSDANPELVVLDVSVGTLPSRRIEVTPEELNFPGLRRHLPTISCSFRPLFDEYLNEELQLCLERSHPGGDEVQSGEVTVGCLFKESGLHHLEGNNLCAVEGDSVIG